MMGSKVTRNPAVKTAWIEAAVASQTDECLVWPWSKGSRGYGQIKRCGQMEQAHVIVCTLAHGPRPEGMLACHSCRNKCCNPRHLEWGSPSKNNGEDCLRDGTLPAKLTVDQVVTIRGLYASGCGSQRRIAAHFGISSSATNDIILFRRWAHIP